MLARRGGNITESKQFGDEDSGLFFMRVQVMTTVPREELEKDLAELAETYTMTWSLDEVGRPPAHPHHGEQGGTLPDRSPVPGT